MNRLRPFGVLFVLLTLPLYALDQATKLYVLRTLSVDEFRDVIPGFFALVQWHNTGAAFSMFSNSNVFFMGLSVVAVGVLALLAWRGVFRDQLGRLGWALLLSGILGNLTDRILHGFVID